MTRFRDAGVDAPEAQALLHEYFDGRAATFPGGPEGYRRVMPKPEEFVPPAGIFVIVEDESRDEDVGCGGIRRVAPSASGAIRFEAKHLYLRTETRGRGLGRALLDELERRARELGAQELVLDTNASQVAAGGLYRSSGYEEIEPYNDNANATHWYRKVL